MTNVLHKSVFFIYLKQKTHPLT